MPFSRIFLSAFVILILLSACDQKYKNAEESANEKPSNIPYTHKLAPAETLVFDIDQETSVNNFFYDAFTLNDVEYMGLMNRNNNSLQIYSIPERSLYAKIKFDQEGPESFPKFGAFKVISSDSILILNQYGKNLWLVDIKGNVRKKYDIKNLDGPLFSLGITFYTGIKPLLIGDKLYIKSQSIMVDNLQLEFFEKSNKREIEIDLKNETWKFVDVSYPSQYQGNLWRFDISRDLGKDGNIIYSFAIDSDLQEYNPINWTPTAHPAKSDFVGSINPMTKTEDQEEMAKYFLETPKYTNLVYDKHRDVYYRFVSHGISTVNSVTGDRNTYDDTSFSIIILDSSFNKIGETKVEDKKYQINCYFVTEKGLFISNANPKNAELNEDKLSFTLFALQKTGA